MIITTTNTVPGMEIAEYKGLATGEVVAGINFLKDLVLDFVTFLVEEVKVMKMKLFKQELKP